MQGQMKCLEMNPSARIDKVHRNERKSENDQCPRNKPKCEDMFLEMNPRARTDEVPRTEPKCKDR